MREIKFRGFSVIGEWYYGDLSRPTVGEYSNRTFIQGKTGNLAYEVRPETVGQFTGLLDKNGKEIYEGDIVYSKFETDNGPILHTDVVIYHEGAFYPVCDKFNYQIEVKGNIYENPDYLKN